MKKVLTIILVVAMLLTVSFAFSATVNADYKTDSKYNLLDAKSSTFEGGIGAWVKGLEVTPTIAAGKGVTGDAMLAAPRTNAWDCAFLNVAQIILDNGVGTYEFSCYVKAAGAGDGKLRLMFRGTENYAFQPSPLADITGDDYVLLSSSLIVSEVDKAKGTFTVDIETTNDPSFTDSEDIVSDKILNMCFDNGAGPVYIDDVCIVNLDKMPSPAPTAAPTASPAPTPTLVPTATKIASATTTAPAVVKATATATVVPSAKGNSNQTLIIILVAVSVLLIGTAAVFMFRKPKATPPTDNEKPE